MEEFFSLSHTCDKTKTSFFINFIVLLFYFILHDDDVYFHCAASTVVIS